MNELSSTPPQEVENTENLNEAGEVITEEIIITTAEGVSFDIKNFCLGLTLFEDIFSNVMMGTALITDSANLIGLIPFKGTEFITFSYRTPTFNEKISKSFYITKASDRMFLSNDRQAGYTISFISIEGYKDNVTSVSKKYSDKTDKIVTSVYNEYLKADRFVNKSGIKTELIADTNLGSTATVVAGYWNPLRIINWATSRSFGAATQAPNYMFFESNKSFYFKSIEKLVDEQVKNNLVFSELVYFPGSRMTQYQPTSGYTFNKPELLKQFSNVRNMKSFTMFDSLKAQDYGYYASKLVSIDMTLKYPREFFFDYPTKFKSFKHLEPNNNPTFSNGVLRNPDSHAVVLTSQHKLHNDSKDPLYEKWALQRNSLLFEVGNIKIEVEVPGRTDIEVGKVVSFLYPKNVDKPESMTIDDALDPYMSGFYLITAIRHEFTLNKHTMFLELMKDSFKKALG